MRAFCQQFQLDFERMESCMKAFTKCLSKTWENFTNELIGRSDGKNPLARERLASRKMRQADPIKARRGIRSVIKIEETDLIIRWRSELRRSPGGTIRHLEAASTATVHYPTGKIESFRQRSIESTSGGRALLVSRVSSKILASTVPIIRRTSTIHLTAGT